MQNVDVRIGGQVLVEGAATNPATMPNGATQSEQHSDKHRFSGTSHLGSEVSGGDNNVGLDGYGLTRNFLTGNMPPVR
jgi:hypothetical protein